MNQPPNIILCVMDDHRHDALGAAGHPVVQTPFLDRLASNGTRFSRAYMPGANYAAVCMPSRAMLHTGRHLYEIEDIGRTIPPEHATLGETLREAGYSTFHTGKWHNDNASLNRSFGDGDFIFSGEGMGDPWNLPFFHYDPSGEYGGRLPIINNWLTSREVKERKGDFVMAGRHATDLICDRAAAFVRDYADEAPFFLSLALTSPHDPCSAPEAYHRLYDTAQIPLPENFVAQCPVNTGALNIRDEQLAGFPRNPTEVREHLAAYYAMITHLDDGLARVMAEVEASGRQDNTLFVFLSDHGLSMGSHGLMGKQNLFEESVRVPLIMAGPGIPAGAVRDDPVWHFDLCPTLSRMAGASFNGGGSGRDLEPESAQPEDPRRIDDLYFSYGKTIRAVHEGAWKCIEYRVGEDYEAVQLFHLDDDPQEIRDLASDPAQGERVKRMRNKIREAGRASGDPVPAFTA